MLIGIGGIFVCVCVLYRVGVRCMEGGRVAMAGVGMDAILFLALSSLPSYDRVLLPLGWRWRGVGMAQSVQTPICSCCRVLLRRPITAPVRAIVYYCRCVTRGYQCF